MHKHLKGFMDRTEKAEESFLDRLDIAGRHRLGNLEFPTTEKKNSARNNHQILPQTINLPELPLVRVQDRRAGFDSTSSSIGDITPASHSERSTFERRRRT